MRVGVFPGSFDPLTTAHLAVAEAAIEALDLTRLDLVISTVALAKPDAHGSLDARVTAIERHIDRIPQLRARVTRHQLLADIADGYDVLVIGSDKWHQLHDAEFYGSAAERDAALARLPQVAVAPRAGVAPPPADADVITLEVDDRLHGVSSTAVRAGREEWRA
jgi:nicotinic acid mononucleotide adenylyltransferase